MGKIRKEGHDSLIFGGTLYVTLLRKRKYDSVRLKNISGRHSLYWM